MRQKQPVVDKQNNLNFINKVLQRTCDTADLILKNGNPCDPKYRNGKLTCIHPRMHFCCDGCNHLSTSGCTVKSPACKLWLCYPAAEATPGIGLVLGELYKNTLGKIRYEYAAHIFRASIEEIMEQISELDDKTVENITTALRKADRFLDFTKSIIKLCEGE